jgi:hypothetical protein
MMAMRGMDILPCFPLTMQAEEITGVKPGRAAAPGTAILANPVARDIVMVGKRAIARTLADGLCSCAALHSP